jgi:hypothetical protein
MNVTFSADIQKPLEKWSNKDFLSYFSNRLYMIDKKGLDIPPNGWRYYMSFIKGFRDKFNISNAQYKAFIDILFETVFKYKNFKPNFGCMISEKLYNTFNIRSRNRESFTEDDFETLQKELLAGLKRFPGIYKP